MDIVKSILLQRDRPDPESDTTPRQYHKSGETRSGKSKIQWRNFLHTFDSHNGKAEVGERRSARTHSVMEFMYCIPDLEVFIDKTIKKCLLEYDLDAKDTEAVLDDMEKTWPDSASACPHDQRRQHQGKDNEGVLTGFVCINPAVSADHQTKMSTASLPDTLLRLEKDAKEGAESIGRDRLKKSRSSDDIHSASTFRNGRILGFEHRSKLCRNEDGDDLVPAKRARLSVEDALTTKEPGAFQEESSKSSPSDISGKPQSEMEHEGHPRSENSTPDGNRSPASRHAKLKSRLQQRYMEDKKDNAPPSVLAASPTLSEPQGDVLTPRDSPRESPLAREPVNDPNYELARGNLDLLARAVKIHKLQASKEVPPPVSHEDMPKLIRQTSIPTSPPRLERVVSLEGREVERKDEDLSPSRGCPTLYPNSPLPSKHHQSAHHHMLEPGLHHRESDLHRRAKLLLQQYQNGYHSVIPIDVAGLRRDTRSPSETDRLAKLAVSEQLGLIPRSDILASKLRISPQDASYGHSHELSRARRSRVAREHDHFSPRDLPSPSQTHSAQVDLRSHSIQSSRIASIIAEELQKDDECSRPQNMSGDSSPRPSKDVEFHPRQNIPYIGRITSEESKPTSHRGRRTSRPSAFHHSHSSPAAFGLSSGTTTSTSFRNGDLVHDRLQSSVLRPHLPAGLSQTEVKGLNATAMSMNVPNFLPSHPSLLSSHSKGKLALPAHLAPSVISPYFAVHSLLSGPRRDEALQAVSADDQPEDLSMKSRKRTFEQTEEKRGETLSHKSPTTSILHSSLLKDRLRVPSTSGYFSNPASPETPRVLGKSVSPSNRSDPEVDYHRDYSRNALKASSLWEKRGQVVDLVGSSPMLEKRLMGLSNV